MHLVKYGIGNLVLGSIGFVLNIALIIILTREKNKKPSKILLINLGIADLLISILSITTWLSLYGSKNLSHPSVALYYKIFILGIVFSFCASLWSCWLLTIDRLHAILRPLQHAVYYTKVKIGLHVASTWCYATINTSVIFVGMITNNTHEIIRYLIPPSLLVTIVLLIAAYTIIIRAIVRGNKKLANVTHRQGSKQGKSRAQMNKRIYFHSLVIILNFTICSCPYILYNILFSPLNHDTHPGFMASGTMGLTAITIIDPMSYFFLGLIMSAKRSKSKAVKLTKDSGSRDIADNRKAEERC